MQLFRLERAFGLVNIAFAFIGVWLLARMSGLDKDHLLPKVASTATAPFATKVYLVDALLTMLLLAALAYSGARLVVRGQLAIRKARFVYVCELIYLLTYFCIIPVVDVFLPGPWRWSIVAGLMGGVSLMPQMFTAYPLIGLVVMSLLLRRGERRSQDAV
jgi:sterol desaturase/sphingolipid hydroxylase (fatty acid hydroxylase superfamily)